MTEKKALTMTERRRPHDDRKASFVIARRRHSEKRFSSCHCAVAHICASSRAVFFLVIARRRMPPWQSRREREARLSQALLKA